MKVSRNSNRKLGLALIALLTTLSLCLSPVIGGSLASADESAQVGFVYIELSTISCGKQQNVVVGLDNGAAIDSATLYMQVDGSEASLEADKIIDDAALFSFDLYSEGEVRLLRIDVQINGSAVAQSFDLDSESNPCTFTVDGVAPVMPLSLEGETEAEPNSDVTFVVSDANGNAQECSTLSDAVVAASEGEAAGNARGKDVVIVLDPGHGGNDGGASANGLTESALTLSIAKYCKAALQQYSGVTVYMTRESDVYVDLKARTDYAKSVGADAIVSIHINSADASSANGAEVWYPNNSSYKNELHSSGASLSQSILNKLTALGLSDRGIKSRDYGDGGSEPRYEDGSMSDYYAIIRRARQNGYLGIIVEHAFITNPNDAAFLGQDSNLRRLGEADAEGIADAFGLTKGYWGQDTEGNWRYYINDVAKTGWICVNGSWYWGDPDEGGSCVNSCWREIDGNWYWFDGNCAMASNRWINTEGAWYWVDASGARQTGWQLINGSWYWLDPETGARATGLTDVYGTKYDFASDGAMVTGWVREGDDWYYFDASGAAVKGWALVNGSWYWLDPETSIMQTGWLELSGNKYFLTASGAMKTGWSLDNGSWYYFDCSGAMTKGWLCLGGVWYWLDPETGVMATGLADVSGTKYCFASNGVMASGVWVLAGSDWYYADVSGALSRGWMYNGNWYYLDPATCKMAKGLQEIGGTKYFFNNDSGAMAVGWGLDSDGSWYWGSSSGALATGWVKAGSWYYMDPETYKMRTGWLELGQSESPARYYLAGSGAMVSDNWVLDGSDWYYADASGAMASGWRYVRGSWYWLDPKTGVMQTGWLQVSGSKYYLGSNGAMLTGWQNIDNSRYYFDSSGACQGEQTLSPVLGSPSASKEVVISKMVAAYKNSGASYPDDELSKGGAPSIESFCSILYEEATDEGVRPELLFCQAMKETGWLRFGGIVKVGEFNFGGLGATDDDPDANKFPDVRTGLRAQTQHLVAYAKAGVNASDLHHGLVDVRFNLVNKGSAPYIQYLGIPDNPQGTGWASSSGYGYDIVQMMKDCFGI